MTNTESIQELLKQASRLEERLDNTRTALDKIAAEQAKAADLSVGVDKRLAVIEEKVNELRRVVEEKDRRRWAILLAGVGSVLSLIVNVILLYFRK